MRSNAFRLIFGIITDISTVTLDRDIYSCIPVATCVLVTLYYVDFVAIMWNCMD